MHMNSKHKEILSTVSDYYSSRVLEFGETPQGVDWNGEAGQVIRFEQLMKVVDKERPFAIIDLGCGYGAMYEWMQGSFDEFSYKGIDISQDMISSALKLYGRNNNFEVECSENLDAQADYLVASGIFNVKLGQPESEWKQYILDTLESMDRAVTKGFAFNCLTSYSDADKMRPDLHYANSLELFDFCKKNFSRNVALLHDYELYEFTILVRKSPQY